MKRFKVKAVKTKKDYEAALRTVEGLWDAKAGTEEHDLLEVMAILVERYEEEAFPMEDPDPVEAIRFRLEQSGKEPKDLVPVLGSRERVSEVLHRKRGLSLRMIRKLHDELHIPFESLIPSASR